VPRSREEGRYNAAQSAAEAEARIAQIRAQARAEAQRQAVLARRQAQIKARKMQQLAEQAAAQAKALEQAKQQRTAERMAPASWIQNLFQGGGGERVEGMAGYSLPEQTQPGQETTQGPQQGVPGMAGWNLPAQDIYGRNAPTMPSLRTPQVYGQDQSGVPFASYAIPGFRQPGIDFWTGWQQPGMQLYGQARSENQIPFNAAAYEEARPKGIPGLAGWDPRPAAQTGPPPGYNVGNFLPNKENPWLKYGDHFYDWEEYRDSPFGQIGMAPPPPASPGGYGYAQYPRYSGGGGYYGYPTGGGTNFNFPEYSPQEQISNWYEKMLQWTIGRD
jgi:hypothetical protein